MGCAVYSIPTNDTTSDFIWAGTSNVLTNRDKSSVYFYKRA